MEESVKQAAQYSPLVLAYLGDAVYELYIRERILAGGNQPVNRMHGKAVHFVKAETQAKLLRYLEPELTEAESGILRRGRNAHANTMAKNASMIDYRRATAFEALVGYWKLSGQEERFRALLTAALAALEEEERQAHERKRN
nr:ribonuclease III domain-containing protein [uncultured Stomatobaculum sp.]